MASTVWKGHLTFGLVSIPIKIFRAARAEKISFRQLHKVAAQQQLPQSPQSKSNLRQMAPIPMPEAPPGPTRLSSPAQAAAFEMHRPASMPPPPAPPQVSRVRQQFLSSDTAEEVERTELVHGYEYAPDQYVVIEKDELKDLAPETARDMQIMEFVKLSDIDPVYYESSYYVAPDKAGEKAYALLYEALKQAGYVALAEFAMHRREHVVVVRPGPRGLLLHTMFYETEVRKEDEYPANPKLVADKELNVARMLVESMAGPFEPSKFRDKYREKLEALINAKIEGRQVAPAAKAAEAAPAMDIMQALQQSLELARKPPASESKPAAVKKTTAPAKAAGRRKSF